MVDVREIFPEKEIDVVLSTLYEQEVLERMSYKHKLYVYLRMLFPTVQVNSVLGGLREIKEASVEDVKKKKDYGAVKILRGILTIEAWSEEYPIFLCPVHRIPLQRGFYCPLCGEKYSKKEAVMLIQREGVFSDDTGTLDVVLISEDIDQNLVLGAEVEIVGFLANKNGVDVFQILKILDMKPLVKVKPRPKKEKKQFKEKKKVDVEIDEIPDLDKKEKKKGMEEFIEEKPKHVKKEEKKTRKVETTEDREEEEDFESELEEKIIRKKEEDREKKLLNLAKKLVDVMRIKGGTICMSSIKELKGFREYDEEEIEEAFKKLGVFLDDDGCLVF